MENNTLARRELFENDEEFQRYLKFKDDPRARIVIKEREVNNGDCTHDSTNINAFQDGVCG